MRQLRSGGLRLASAALFVGLAAACTSAAASDLPASARWKPNVNYTVISPAQPTHAPPGKVQVMEFFYLACPYCHALEPYLEAWRKSKPAYVEFVRVPVTWAPLYVADARLYYTLEAMGRADLVGTAFNTIHRLERAAGGNENVLIGATPTRTIALQAAFVERHGASAAAFLNAYRSFDVQIELGRATRLWQTFDVTHTPTIIIAGRFETAPSQFRFRPDRAPYTSGDHRTIELMNFLTRWVHDHPHAG
jgi:thiol:disulfide interchange protein DsbA